MITALLIGWLVVVGIQLLYILFIFSRTAFFRQPHAALTPITTSESAPATVRMAYRSSQGHAWQTPLRRQQSDNQLTEHPKLPGVTIVVCARNELDNLTELLPLLDAQHYPAFEVLVMDDRSTDGTDTFLENDITGLTHVQFIRIDKEYEHITPKKYALTIALKKATYNTVLLTDADCRPASEDWLSGMVAPFGDETKEIVLGFSPYEHRPGLLNLLIRSETLFTAVHYFSLALVGLPYMGVGRNLAYRTQVFFANKGFYTHKNILGGDDDLFINEVASGQNTTISLDPVTFAWSKPKETWAAWRIQKRRHLNVGKYYKTGHKIRLGLLTGSHILTWLTGLSVGALVLAMLLLHRLFTPDEWLLLLIATGAFAGRLLLFWGIVGRISYRLDHTVHWAIMPFIDLMMAIYYGFAGLKVLFTRRQKRYYWR